jgi:hypothetical protein
VAMNRKEKLEWHSKAIVDIMRSWTRNGEPVIQSDVGFDFFAKGLAFQAREVWARPTLRKRYHRLRLRLYRLKKSLLPEVDNV